MIAWQGRAPGRLQEPPVEDVLWAFRDGRGS